MELGKYKNVQRAMKRTSGGLRTVVYTPNIEDSNIDFPDIENPRELAGGGAVKKVIKKILSEDDLRRLGKKEGIPDEDIEKFLSGEYGLLPRGLARGLVRRDKEGNIFIKDTYSSKYDPIRKQMLKDDPGMFDDLFNRMISEHELEKFKKSGRKPNAEGGIQRDGFKDGGLAKDVQNFLIKSFPNETLDFKNYKYGVSSAQNRNLYKQLEYVANERLKKGKAYNYISSGTDLSKLKYEKGYGNADQFVKKAKEKGITISKAKRFAQTWDIDTKKSPYQKSGQDKIYDLTILDDPDFVEDVIKSQVKTGTSTNKAMIKKYGPEIKYKSQQEELAGQKARRQTEKRMGGDPKFKQVEKKYGAQKSHMGDIWSETIEPGNIGIAPTDINKALAESGGIEEKINELTQKRKRLIKQNPSDLKKQLTQINNQLAELEALAGGYKRVPFVDPITKETTFFGGGRFPMDPTGQFEGMTERQARDFRNTYLTKDGKVKPRWLDKNGNFVGSLEDFNNLEKALVFDKNYESMKKTVSKQKNQLVKSFQNINRQDAINAIGSLGCPATYMDGGRVQFAKGSSCYAKGLKVLEEAKAGSTSALGKVRKFFKTPAGKFLGAVPIELAFEAAFVLPDYAEGKPWDEILHATTAGLFGLGTSPEESIYKYSGNDPRVKDYQKVKQLEQQLIDDMEKFKNFEQDPKRYAGTPQLRKLIKGLVNRIVENSKLYQQQKHILDPKGEYAQVMEKAKQLQQADYKKNIEESRGRQIVGDVGEKIVGAGKGVYDYLTKAYEYMKDKAYSGAPITDEVIDDAAMFANGGRVGFEKGGFGKMGRRGFLKLIGGIAALIGAVKAGLKLETKVAKQVLKNAPTGTPEWFAPLVEKIAKEGIDVPPELMLRTTTGRETVKKLEIKDPVSNTTDKYYLFENPDTGEILVDVDVPGIGANDEPFSLYMRPKKVEGVTEEGIQQIDEGEFLVNEQRATGVQSGPDDWDIELLETHTDLEGSASDWHALEKLATGKTDDVARAKKQKFKNEVEADPTQDIINRQGEYDYPGPDVDDYE